MRFSIRFIVFSMVLLLSGCSLLGQKDKFDENERCFKLSAEFEEAFNDKIPSSLYHFEFQRTFYSSKLDTCVVEVKGQEDILTYSYKLYDGLTKEPLVGYEFSGNGDEDTYYGEYGLKDKTGNLAEEYDKYIESIK